VVGWTTWTSEVLPGLVGFWEELLEIVFETEFYLEEYLVGFLDTEPITPSTGGVVCDFDVMGSDNDRRASGNNSYKVLD